MVHYTTIIKFGAGKYLVLGIYFRDVSFVNADKEHSLLV